MSIQVESTKLHGVYKITPETHEDYRGIYRKIYDKACYNELLPDGMEFVEADISVSTQNTIRGIHGDFKTWKLVSCLYGKFYLVVVNWDKDSHEYKKWTSFTLSDRIGEQILIPAGYGNAHMVLSDVAIFHYAQSHTYQGTSHQFFIPYNHPELNIFWPLTNRGIILSERDSNTEVVNIES